MGKSKLKNMDNPWVDIPVTSTVTTGSSATINLAKNKEFIYVSLRDMVRAAQTGVGADMFEATISGNIPDFYSQHICSYSGSTAVLVYVFNSSSGTMTVTARVIGAALPANTKVTARGILRIDN